MKGCGGGGWGMWPLVCVPRSAAAGTCRLVRTRILAAAAGTVSQLRNGGAHTEREEEGDVGWVGVGQGTMRGTVLLSWAVLPPFSSTVFWFR